MIPFLLHAPDDGADADADGDDEKGEWESGERGARLIDDTQLTTQHIYGVCSRPQRTSKRIALGCVTPGRGASSRNL